MATKRVRAGDLVRIHTKLRDGCEHAKVSIWGGEQGYELSPYVDPGVAGIIEKGRPTFARPFHQTLHEKRTKHTFELVADVDMSIALCQQVDTAKDPTVKVRIVSYGSVAQKIRRFCGRLFRKLGYRHSSENGKS